MIQATLDGEGQSTNTIRPSKPDVAAPAGHLVLSLSGTTWSATVTLQRTLDSGSTWLDVDSFTSNIETSISDSANNVLYRATIKTGDYSSGSVDVILAK